MKNSNFCLSCAGSFAVPAACVLLSLLTAAPAAALDPSRTPAQYTWNEWTAKQEFPGGVVYGIAQTPDGYLWLAADNGLVRYDGVTFQLLDHARNPDLPAGPLLGVITDKRGDLWVKPQTAGLVRYSQGTFVAFSPALIHRPYNLSVVALAQNGDLLLGGMDVPIRFDGTKATPLISPYSLVLAMAETADGQIWYGTRDSGLWRVEGKRDYQVPGLQDKKINCLLAHGAQVWIGTDAGLAHWDGSRIDRTVLNNIQVFAIRADHDGNIWAGTSGGLYRLNSDGISLLSRNGESATRSITSVFEDREGCVWFGSSVGLGRLCDTAFLTFPNASPNGQPNAGALAVDSLGRTWCALRQGGLAVLEGDRWRPLHIPALDRQVVYSLAAGPNEMWAGTQRAGLVHIGFAQDNFHTKTYGRADGLPSGSIYALKRVHDGDLWIGTIATGASRFSNGQFTNFTTSQQLPSNAISAIEETGDGAIWLATPGGISRFYGNEWRHYDGRSGVPSSSIHCLFRGQAGSLWIGTNDGLFLLSRHEVHAIEGSSSVRDPIYGIAEDQRGFVWLLTSKHIVRVNRQQLVHGDLTDRDVRTWGPEDGVVETAGFRRSQSVVTDKRGRIWLSLTQQILVADPARISDSLPVLIHGRTIWADGKIFDVANPARIPPLPRRITLSYIGVQLAAPERVQYRTRLDNYDANFGPITGSTSAEYTNLSPGNYRFQVMASGPDGIWTKPVNAAEFSIEPALWQAMWFRFAALAMICGAVVAIYRLRTHALKRQLSLRFEERLYERTRIAQELHDTLLQGFLSASMQLHVTADGLPENSPVKTSLGRVLALMHGVIDEARNAVRGLRSASVAPADLEESFSRIRLEFEQDQDIAFRIVVEGETQPLHPLVRDDVYRIGREALVNAFRHSRARRIEMEIDYGTDLHLQVRDDGCGVDPDFLRNGKAGHWGLPGMRERAERIGAALELRSSTTAGTEVSLTVPGSIAFEPGKNPSREVNAEELEKSLKGGRR